MLIEIKQPGTTGRTALLNLGFRPFFAGAAIFSVLSMLVWLGLYTFGLSWQLTALPAVTWHAHEMVYGYAMAVIAGFLLTAVKNWTGVQTLHGLPLLLLFLLWLTARILLVTGGDTLLVFAAIADCAFMTLLVAAVAYPVIRVKQWKQVGVLSGLVLLALANSLFYAGILDIFSPGIRAGLYSGVYLIMALIFVMARRVLPFFIEKAAEHPVRLTNRKWLDVTSLVMFLAFWIADIAQPDSSLVALLAAILCLMHLLRMAGWYTRELWNKPLLWVLYLGYGALVAGFALKAAVPVAGVQPPLALHAFTYGGIGLFTLGMMARVTLGHTGRNISTPPAAVSWIFACMVAGAVLRVVFPLADPLHYTLWSGLSQGLWITAFSLFLLYFLPMLVQPRADGQAG